MNMPFNGKETNYIKGDYKNDKSRKIYKGTSRESKEERQIMRRQFVKIENKLHDIASIASDDYTPDFINELGALMEIYGGMKAFNKLKEIIKNIEED